MPVFFIPTQTVTGPTVRIDGPLFSHLRKSLRCREGERIVVCDQTRHRHTVQIQTLHHTSLEGVILQSVEGPPPSPIKVVLGQAILKGDHMNWAIQKATELGVSTIVPLLTDRVIVRPQPKKFPLLQERYARIALDAAQQSEQWEVPRVLPPTPFQKFLHTFSSGVIRCILIERQGAPGLEILSLNELKKGDIVIMSGPEGGWTEEERQLAETFQFSPVALGEAILRGETAPLAALSIIQFQLGKLGKRLEL